MNRPPSRHKTPPKAVGLEIPATPHTPPKTQKDYDEYLHTINLKGIGFLIKDVGTYPVNQSNSDYESFSSSKLWPKTLVEDIQDFKDKGNARVTYTSPEIIKSHKEKKMVTPRIDQYENVESRPATASITNNTNADCKLIRELIDKQMNPLISYC